MTWACASNGLNCINNVIISRFHKLVKWVFGCADPPVETPDPDAADLEDQNPTKAGPDGEAGNTNVKV